MAVAAPEISVVLSCFFEEATVLEFHARLSRTLAATGRSHEIIYVNDGSTDGTWDRLRRIFEEDASVTAVVDLFRNSGQAAALTAGALLARGKAVVFLDSDLQLSPEDLPLLLERFDRGYDIVSGCRPQRRDDWMRRTASRVANVTMRALSGADLTDFGCTFKVVDARLLAGFEHGPLRPIRLPYLVAAAGRCAEVPVSHAARPHGRSGWTYPKLLRYWLESAVGMSERPFQYVGFALLLLALIGTLRLAVNLVWPFSLLETVTPGFLLNVVVLGALASVGMIALVGEYALRSYNLLLRQPAYIVREVLRRPE
ncbi:MAG TPA: glycosyltransferase family 2 protein [Candidatus Limnocylindrales bacterium]|nr:glycosyltransferase family 2 protein [Candidatus Limnocylindrales bacterium]